MFGLVVGCGLGIASVVAAFCLLRESVRRRRGGDPPEANSGAAYMAVVVLAAMAVGLVHVSYRDACGAKPPPDEPAAVALWAMDHGRGRDCGADDRGTGEQGEVVSRCLDAAGYRFVETVLVEGRVRCRLIAAYAPGRSRPEVFEVWRWNGAWRATPDTSCRREARTMSADMLAFRDSLGGLSSLDEEQIRRIDDPLRARLAAARAADLPVR